MISDKILRTSSAGSQSELGLNSYACFERKPSTNTQTSSNDCKSDGSEDKSKNKVERKETNSRKETNIQELRIKLLKLAEYKAKMEINFKSQIVCLNNELAAMNAENDMLTKVVRQARKNVSDMKEDVDFIKRCMENRQLRSTVSPDFSKCLKDLRQTDRFSPRSKPSRLFNPNMLKIK